MTARWLLTIAGICLWWLAGNLRADPTATAIELGQAREVFIESSHQLYTTRGELNPLMSVPEPDQLVPLARIDAKLPGYWIHLALINRTDERDWMLDISNALVRHVIVHSVSSSRHRISEQGFIKTWPFDLRYGTELALPRNELTNVWIYVAPAQGAEQPLLSVLTNQLYQEKTSSYGMQLLIAIGALVILAIYQIVIFVPTRDPAYGWSALSSLAAALAWSSQCKALLYFLSLDAHWYWLYFPLFISVAALARFARDYLRVHYPHPLAYLLDAASVIVLTSGIAGALLLPTHQYSWLLTKVLVVALLMLVVAGIWRLRERYAAIRFYLLGTALLLAGLLFYLLDQALHLNLIENGILATTRLQLLVMIILMLGLIDRMSLLQRERSQQDTKGGTDPVTGLPNRAAFERDVRAWEAYCKEGIMQDFYLSFFDVANLRDVNKAKGAKEGDRLLRLIARWLQEKTGNHNVYRIGGNEFLALTQQTIPWDLSQLDRVLRQEGFRNINVSIGSSCFSESSCRSSLLKIADERLHKKALQ